MTLIFDDSLVGGAGSSAKAIALYGTLIVGGVLSILWRSEIGLYLLTLVLPLQTTRYHLHGLPLGANVVDILLLCSLVGAFVRPEPRLKRSAVMGFAGFMAIFYYLSLWRGAFFLSVPYPLWFNDSRLVDYKNIMVMPLLTLVATLVIRTRRQIGIILILCCVTSAIVDYSYLKSSAGRDFTHYSEETRDAGPLGYAGENGLASYVVEITLCLFPLLALDRHLLMKTLLMLLLAANIWCILFSYSREAYIALAGGLCLLAVLRLRWALVPLILLALAWPTVLPKAVQERITMTYTQKEGGAEGKLDDSAQERVTLWTDAMTLVKENPLLGSGFLTYADMNRVGSYRDTHNFYLKMLVETGVPGLVLFMIQLFLFCREGVRLFRRATDSFFSLFGLGFAALIVATAVVNVFGDRWLFIQVDSNLWILLGCVLCASSLVQLEELASREAPLEGDTKRDGDGNFIYVDPAPYSLSEGGAYATRYGPSFAYSDVEMRMALGSEIYD